jgi:hypothetical protein
LSERLVNKEQKRNADEEWELRLRLKAKDEVSSLCRFLVRLDPPLTPRPPSFPLKRRKERLKEKIKKKAFRAEDSTDSDNEDDNRKKERNAREGRKKEDEEGSSAPGLPTPDSSSVAPNPPTS